MVAGLTLKFVAVADYKRRVTDRESVMTYDQDPNRDAKIAAADHAAGLVEDGMRLGLGTGSTSYWLVKAIARRMREESLRLDLFATSDRCESIARAEGLYPIDSDELESLDLTIDGADECDRKLNLIKGGGGALLTEKIAAVNSGRLIVVADSSKRRESLGSYPLPVEIARFAWKSTNARVLGSLESRGFTGIEATLRRGAGGPFVTQEGNLIVDYRLGRIEDPGGLHRHLVSIVGVVETGIFPGMCDLAIFGDNDGTVCTVSADRIKES